MATQGPVRIYNGTSIGNALRVTLDQFVQSNEISQTLAEEIQAQFEANVLRILNSGVSTKVTFRNARIICYRYSPTFKTDHGEQIHCSDRVKILALDCQKIQQQPQPNQQNAGYQ